MVSPSQKKAAVAHVIDQQLYSMRRAYHSLGLPRLTYRYRPKPLTDQQQLHQRIETLSWANPRYGYRRIRRLLTKEGWTIRRKQVQRVRRCQGLKVRPKPKKIPRRGTSTGLPTQGTHRHHVWTWDFIFDRTDNGGTIKMMSIPVSVWLSRSNDRSQPFRS